MADNQSPTESFEEQRKAAVAAYNRIVSAARLLDFRLLASKLEIRAEFHKIRRDELTEEEDLTNRPFGGTFSAKHYSSEHDAPFWTIVLSLQVKKGRKIILPVEISYTIGYGSVPDIWEEHYHAFLTKVGRFATYPYFRASFRSLRGALRLNFRRVSAVSIDVKRAVYVGEVAP